MTSGHGTRQVSEGRRGAVTYPASSVAIVVVVILIGRVSGLVRDLILAPLFGAGVDIDALVAARTIPELVLISIGFGISTAMVPALAMLADEDGGLSDAAWKAVSVVFNWSFAVLAAVTLAGMAFPELLLVLVAPGLDPVRETLAADLLRLMIPVVLLAGCGGFLGATLHYFGRFGLPSSRTALTNLAIIALTVVGWRTLGVRAVAIGWLIGAALQLLVLVPFNGAFLRNHRFSFDLTTPGVGAAFRLLIPVALSNILLFGRVLIERQFASMLAPGALSHLSYAMRLASAPMLVLTNSIGVVYLALLSRQWAGGDRSSMQSSLHEALRLLLFGLTPFVALFLLAPQSTVAVLLERGAFTADDSAATGLLLMAYVMMMVGTSVAGLLSQLFFATRNVAVLNLTLLSGLGIQIVVTFLLLDSLGALAVALGTGIGVVTSATVLWWTVSRRLLGKSLLAMIGRDVLEFGAAGLIMGVVWKVGERIASGFGGEAISPVEYFLSLSVATAAYLGVCHAFGGRELSSLVARIRSRGGMD